MYPVDLPAVDDTDLTLASERYFSSLESRHHKTEEFQSSTATKVSFSFNASLQHLSLVLLVGFKKKKNSLHRQLYR